MWHLAQALTSTEGVNNEPPVIYTLIELIYDSFIGKVTNKKRSSSNMG